MPPIPPWPPSPPSFGSGISTIIASVVIMSEATPHASTIAVQTTFVGSIIPCCKRSPYSPVEALNPNEADG